MGVPARGSGPIMSDGDTEESDQLPEEAPSDQVADDDSGSGPRTEATDSPGAADEGDTENQATGNPKNAGQD